MAEQLITVRAARADGRVALWERHAAHPGGEAFIADGSGTAQVARTPAVLHALATGALMAVTASVALVTPEPEPEPEPVELPPPAARRKGRQ